MTIFETYAEFFIKFYFFYLFLLFTKNED